MWLGVIVLAGCPQTPDATEPEPTAADTGTPPTSALPRWTYTSTVDEGGAHELTTLDGAILARLSTVSFTGNLLGPTLVAEPEHEVLFSLTNRTEAPFSISSEGLSVVQAPVVEEGSTAMSVFRSTLGPGVFAWSDPSLASSGLTGVVTVRDPAEFPVNDIDEQINVVLYEPDPALVEVDACVLGQASTGAGCPAWEPAQAGFVTFVLQRLIQTYVPDPTLRHGGPANEFITSSPQVPRLELTAGGAVRVNLLNLTSATRTLDLGGLPMGDESAPVGTVTLAPGEGMHLLSEALVGPSEHPVVCVDCSAAPAEIAIIP